MGNKVSKAIIFLYRAAPINKFLFKFSKAILKSKDVFLKGKNSDDWYCHYGYCNRKPHVATVSVYSRKWQSLSLSFLEQ